MTWRDTYWDDATASPAYFEAAGHDTVFDGDYGTRMFGAWIEQEHPYRHDLIRALEYVLVVGAYANDIQGLLKVLHDRLPRPWDDPAMETALVTMATYHQDAPASVRADEESLELAAYFETNPYAFELWRDTLYQSATEALYGPEVLPAFVAACQSLGYEVQQHVGVAPSGDQRADDWRDGVLELSAAFSLHPESNTGLPGKHGWADAQQILWEWGVDSAGLAAIIDDLYQDGQGLYQDDRVKVQLTPGYLGVDVIFDSGLNAHNSGILATLTTDGAWSHYVQFKDLVLLYTDQADKASPIYRVMKRLGDIWAGGNAENYVVRRGTGRSAYLSVTPVRESHKLGLAAVIKRCSGGMPVKILD